MVLEWRIDGAVVSNNTSNTLTIDNISAAHSVTVEFELIPLTPPTITVYNAPPGRVGDSYGAIFVATGNPAPTFSHTGTLPPGLTLNSSTGVLSGIPTTAGTFDFTIVATNSEGTDNRAVTIVIYQRPTITVYNAPNATRGSAYSFTFEAIGSPVPTWSFTGTLPPGLTLNSATGVLSGTPTTVGTFNFNVFATNAVGSDTKALQITVTAATVPPPIWHNIVYNANGGIGSAIYDTAMQWNSHTVRPANTFTRTGYTFNGWNTAPNGSGTAHVADSSIQVTAQVRLYAQWLPVATPTPQPTPAPTAPPSMVAPLPFIDVAATDWFYSYVRTVWENQLFQGSSHNTFEPESSMTRAMFVQVLANLDGVNLSNYANQSPIFGDVGVLMWYFPAIQWAAGQGIISGLDNTYFAPNQPITREEMALLLNNYIVSRDINLPQDETAAFADYASISECALEAVMAIQSAGIIVGHPNGNFAPNDTATRAEVAAIFTRFLEVADLPRRD